jgi:hypothetical protein
MNNLPLIAEIAGYAAIFGEPDLNGDVIARGAFANTLVKRQAPVRMLYAHAAERPIGRWTVLREDARGLFARGALLLSSSAAREVYALLSGGAVDGLSIGYQTVRARKAPRGAARRIMEADLWEISVVTFPMAQGARVTSVGAPQPAREGAQIMNRLQTQPKGPSPHLDCALSPARSSVRTPVPPAGVRLFADAPPFAEAQFAKALRGAASILSV